MQFVSPPRGAAFVRDILVAAALVLASFGAAAQSFPARTVRIVVPFPPGGTADALSRLTAEKLTGILGRHVIVENRAGAGGNLAAEFVWRAQPDGHTLLASPPHLLTINHLLYKLAFDPARFVPVSIIAAYPNVLLAGPKLQASSLEELIAQARAHPGKLDIASAGNGTSSHLSAELLKSMAGIDLGHVPYKGTAPAMIDLLGGQVEAMFDNLITAMAHVKSGRLKLLGVGGAQRVAAFPEVPAIAELLSGFRSETWMGIVAPPGTSPQIAARLSSAIARAVQEPDFRRFIAELQAEPVGNTPREMAEVVHQDAERWAQVIRAARITIQ